MVRVAHAGNTVPDWVKAAAAQPLPDLPGSAKAVELLDEETYTVGPDGRATLRVRGVVKILRPQGRDAGVVRVPYDKDEKILSMHVWSIDAAGHEYAMKDNEIIDAGTWGGEALYSDDRFKVASPPGRDPGGVVAIEYEQRQRPYIAEANWWIQGTIPVVSQSFTLVLPAGYSHAASWAHHARVPETDLGNNSYKWEIDHQPAVDLDDVPLAPAWLALAGRLTVHYSGPGFAVQAEDTWQGLGEWYTALARDRMQPTSEIAAKAAELTAGKTDFYDKTKSIGDFVQREIRYVAIEIGIGGNQPHAAGDTFRGRYGDCKDKATLLSAMLSSVGIHSTLVIVDTERGVIDPDAPSILGNHAIAAIQIPAGYDSPKLHSVVTLTNGRRYLVFDPTWDQTPFGQLEDNLQGSYGLLLEGDASELIRFPVLSPELNRLNRSGAFELAADGTLKGTVTERRYGDLAEDDRYIFGRSLDDQQKYLDHRVARDFMGASISGVEVKNARELNQDFMLDFKLEADRYASSTGPLLMVRPRVFGTYVMPIDDKRRKVEIDLGETMEAHDEYDIQLPDGYAVDELPEPVKADFGFASYESTTELRGHTLHYSRTYVVKQLTLPPDKYPELQKLAAMIGADEQNYAVLKRGN